MIEDLLLSVLEDTNIVVSDQFKAVFFNHMNEFVKRIQENEKLTIEIDEDMRKQIPDQFYAEVDEFLEKFCKLANLDFSQLPIEEKFLIATHFMVAERK